MTCKSHKKEVRTGGISAFLMAKEGRKKGADGESKETLPAGPDWHITHRCHKREFLLKFARDRRRWLEILLEATKRYGLVVLNYMVTSNHIHLLAYDGSGREAIPRSMQLVAGRSGQEYNDRKKRRGAFWQDRYHATAVEDGEHLLRCMVYLDLNPSMMAFVSIR
jgi:putative transposase